jgi:hypothetical protein
VGPAAVDRHDRRLVQCANRPEVVVAALHAEGLHVRLACSVQRKAHGDLDGILVVGSESHQAGALDGVPSGCRSVEEGAQIHRRTQELHALSKCAASEWVHSSHQHTSGIALDL